MSLWARQFLVLISCFTLFMSFDGNTADAQTSEQAARLQQIKNEIEEATRQRNQLQQQAEAEGAAAANLAKELVLRAASIRLEEAVSNDIQNNIRELDREQLRLEDGLKERRKNLSALLAALERLSQRPPALVLIKPADTLDTVRSASLLTTTLPAIQRESEALRQDMEALVTTREKLTEERRAHQVILANLQSDRDNMARLLAEKQRAQQSLLSNADSEAARLRALVAEAQNLEALLEQLSRAPLPGEAESPAIRGPQDYPESLPITRARGNLIFPVAGTVSIRYGANQAIGQSKGIRIQTRQGSQVVSPYDGRILFAGQFRSYGQLLIIAHGEGYHSLLAGMDTIYAKVGDWVLAGEPVAIMKSINDSENAGNNNSNTNEELYLEFRRNGEPVNPVPWLAAETGKVNGS